MFPNSWVLYCMCRCMLEGRMRALLQPLPGGASKQVRAACGLAGVPPCGSLHAIAPK